MRELGNLLVASQAVRQIESEEHIRRVTDLFGARDLHGLGVLDTRVASTYEIFKVVTALPDLAHQQDVAGSQQIVAYVKSFKRLDFLPGGSLRVQLGSLNSTRGHVDEVLVIQSATVEVQCLQMSIDQVKLDNVVQKIREVVVRQV